MGFDLAAQDSFQINYQTMEKFKLTEVSNWRIRVNNKYQGLTYKQIRGILEVKESDDKGQLVQGKFFLFSTSKRNTQLIANKIDRIIDVSFSILANGRYRIPAGQLFPTTRDFPVFLNEKIRKGKSWSEYGTKYVDPLNSGKYTRVRFFCEYTYQGEKVYKSKPYHLITAQYALRYKPGDDPKGDQDLKQIRNAGHRVEIYFDADNNKPVYLRDMIIENLGGEVFEYKDGRQIVRKGFTHIWFDHVQTMNKEKIIKDLEKNIEEKESDKEKDKTRVPDKDDIPGVIIRENENGINITLPDIHFVPNKADILPVEKNRLDTVADTLKKIGSVKSRTFMVTGHTARVGKKENQKQLSVERARAIVDYLVNKGIPEKQFIYQGKGSEEPVAPNDTEENRAKNRRVEITIMED